MSVITQAELKSWLSYDQVTGRFEWLRSYRNQRLGKPVGGVDPDGYRVIKVCGSAYRAHRLVWLYLYGSFPSGVIDHIDGNRDNNAAENLRDVTISANSCNQKRAHADSQNGLLGVDLNKRKGRFRARIQVNGARVSLGGFSTAEEAHAAYLRAKRVMHETCTI